MTPKEFILLKSPRAFIAHLPDDAAAKVRVSIAAAAEQGVAQPGAGPAGSSADGFALHVVEPPVD